MQPKRRPEKQTT